MSERKYTVHEIDELRAVCERRWLFGSAYLSANTGCSRSYKSSEKDIGVEQLVRTYMLSGITAQDIYETDRPKETK